MWAAPIGAFGAIAFTVGKFGAGSLVSLGKLLGGFYVTCLIFVFGVLWPVAHWCGFSLFKLIRYIREELLIVFATTSSETVLPQLMTQARRPGLRGKHRRPGDSDGLFVQSGRDVPVPCDDDGIFGAGDQHAPGHLAAAGAAGRAAAVVERRCGSCRRGLRRAGRDDCIDGNDSGREHRAGARNSPADVGGIDADECGRERGRDDRGREVGARAGRRDDFTRLSTEDWRLRLRASAASAPRLRRRVQNLLEPVEHLHGREALLRRWRWARAFP